MKYRIMKTDTGKYVAQVKRNYWDDIFYAGTAGLVEYSHFKRRYGSHNNRYSDTIEECDRIIERHKEMEMTETGKNLTKVKDV